MTSRDSQLIYDIVGKVADIVHLVYTDIEVIGGDDVWPIRNSVLDTTRDASGHGILARIKNKQLEVAWELL